MPHTTTTVPTCALGAMLALGALLPASESPTPPPTDLAREVTAFNDRARESEIGNAQLPLTEAAVIAAIRWNLLSDTELVITDETRAALLELVRTGDFPESFALESLTGYEPDDKTVFTVWSVRLRIPGGPHASGTTCIVIDERMLDSRIMGPMERAAVLAWRKRASEKGIASFERQMYQELREKAIEVDREH